MTAIAFLLIILAVVGIFLYFFPTCIAKKRKHPNLAGIFIVNLFFGWSVIGWVGALVWAVHNSASGSPE